MRAYSFDLESFADRNLGGDVRNLAGLSFTTMRVVPQQYDFALMDHMDCDDTDLAWEVYNRVWGLERSPESPPVPTGWTHMLFRGDTMNSFRTLFGHEIIPKDICVTGGDGVQGFKGLRRFGVDEELFDKVHEFWYTYHSIGNFLPLPNAKVCGKTINTYRTVWYDYFDAFLGNLHACLTGDVEVSDNGRPSLPKLVEANSFFWDRYRGEDGWESFVREFMLEGYCDGYLRPRKLYRGMWHWQHNVSRADYVKACHEYIDTATSLIAERGVRMMAVAARRAVPAHGPSENECP
jgi:hypothetical protein